MTEAGLPPPVARLEQEPEEPNWDAIFTQTFLLSQGNPQVQHRIFLALALGPLRGKKIPREALARYESAARYGATLAERGDHVRKEVTGDNASSAELEAQIRSYDMREVFDNPSVESRGGDEGEQMVFWFGELMWSLIREDHDYLRRFSGRPIKGKNRDKWSSFVIDFCVLQRGTPPWPQESLDPSIQKMCAMLGRYIERGGVDDNDSRRKLKKVVSIYLSKHRLNSETKKILATLRSQI